MRDDATLTELNTRIAAIRENIRELIEQAAAYSGAADQSARQIGSQIRKPSSQRFSKSGMLCWVNRTNLNSSGRRLRSAGAEAAPSFTCAGICQSTDRGPRHAGGSSIHA